MVPMQLWMFKPNLTNGLWFALYLATMAGLVYWLAEARGWALTTLDNPQAQAHWLEWKTAAAGDQDQPSLVARRIPKSDNPPALILFRDSFPGILVTCLVLGTFLFCFMMVLVRGAFRPSARQTLPVEHTPQVWAGTGR